MLFELIELLTISGFRSVYFKNLSNMVEKYKAYKFLEKYDYGVLSTIKEILVIEMYFNEIVNIEPLASLTNLKYLYLDNNNIKTIEVLCSLVNLHELSLSNNEITYIKPLSSLTNLVSLTLNYNNIYSIKPLKKLIGLKDLHISNNNIVDIRPLKKLNLIELNISDNNVDISQLEKLTSLRKLFYNKDELVLKYKNVYYSTLLVDDICVYYME